MSRVLYLDCFSGISGDMMLGAALDAGLPLVSLQQVVRPLTGDSCELTASSVVRAGITATKFTVRESRATAGNHADDHTHAHAHTHDHNHAHTHPHDHDRTHDGGHGHRQDHGHRTLAEIYALIDRSALPATGRARAREMFERLGEAEAAIHGIPIERIHLHEVGAIDSIVDIVGAVFAMDWFGVDRVVCSPLNVGGGMVESAHGLFPVPAPATFRLLGDAPVYAGPVRQELVTPTGALIATTYAASYGAIPPMRVERIGYGAGDRNPPDTPNVLRILLGEEQPHVAAGAEQVSVIECEIDDMSPQFFGPLMDQLRAAGALDVFYTAVQMKKNRPGTLVTVLAPPERRDTLIEIMFRETTTIGLRHHLVDRVCLTRETVRVETPFGEARVKRALRDGVEVNAAPEFDDCLRLATSSGTPVKDVQGLVMDAFRARRGRPL